MCRRPNVVSAGAFPDIGSAADLAQRLSGALHGDVVFINKPLVRYRVHAGMESLNFSTVLESCVQFREWVRRSSSPLACFSVEIDEWLLRVAKNVLASALVRNNLKAASDAETLLRQLSVNPYIIR